MVSFRDHIFLGVVGIEAQGRVMVVVEMDTAAGAGVGARATGVVMGGARTVVANPAAVETVTKTAAAAASVVPGME